MRVWKFDSYNKLANDMLGSCTRIVTIQIKVGISELVHKLAFIPYSPLIMTNWTVVRVEQKWLVGV